MGAIFDSLYSKYQKDIESNRLKFETHDNCLKGKTAAQIFRIYWNLEGQTNDFDGEEKEKIKLTTNAAFHSLPDELKNLIQ